MTAAEIKAQIRTFLERYIHNHTIQDDEDIFASGFVNSLFAMQLVLFIEKTFSTTIENEDLDLDNFRTINDMCRMIEQKCVSL